MRFGYLNINLFIRKPLFSTLKKTAKQYKPQLLLSLLMLFPFLFVTVIVVLVNVNTAPNPALIIGITFGMFIPIFIFALFIVRKKQQFTHSLNSTIGCLNERFMPRGVHFCLDNVHHKRLPPSVRIEVIRQLVDFQQGFIQPPIVSSLPFQQTPIYQNNNPGGNNFTYVPNQVDSVYQVPPPYAPNAPIGYVNEGNFHHQMKTQEPTDFQHYNFQDPYNNKNVEKDPLI